MRTYPNTIDTAGNTFHVDILQFEENDDVIGGVDGVDNVPIRQAADNIFNLHKRLTVLEGILGGIDIDNLDNLDFVAIALNMTWQTVTVAAGETTKLIDINAGAKIRLRLTNNAACTLSFAGWRRGISGLLTVEAAGGTDRTFTLPATWQPQEDLRTLTVKNAHVRSMPFDLYQLAMPAAPPQPALPEIVIAGALGFRHLTS
jgi:hypothetical protein